MNDLRSEFAKLAQAGYLGNPDGADSYAYLRASSERQVEEGSSFPRQLESINKAAKRDKLRVPFELVFFDDGFTGFEFEHRPALLKLRHEVKTKLAARHLVIEDIDRLSRNADWQQGFLLEEFTRHNLEVHFFISPGSQLERYVRGYIAQEGMKKDIERMRMGNLYKALDGKVTARRPRYGYLKTDPKTSQYVLHPEESKVMRWVYEKIIYHGWTLYQVAAWLNDNQVPTRFKTGFWTAATLHQLVKSPVYKGVFYANRHYQVPTGKYNEAGRPRRTNKLRPESEWIKVDVPAIVTSEEWDLAHEIMTRNAKRSARNGGGRGWLLQSILKCAHCKDYAMVANIGGTKPHRPIRYYGCSSRQSEKARMLKTACYDPYVLADELERRVWEELEAVVYDPGAILRRLEERKQENAANAYQEQLDYIASQLAQLAREREKFEAAYNRDIYTLDEFAEKMKDVRGKVQSLEVARAKLDAKAAEAHSIEQQKQVVLAGLAKIRAEIEQAKRDLRQPQEIPTELKRKILGLLVEVIYVDSVAKNFTIEGEIKGTFALGGDEETVAGPSAPSGPDGGFGSTSSPKWQSSGWCPWR